MWLRQRGRLKAHRERTKSGRIAARASHDRSHAGASPTTRVPEWSFVFISFLHLPLASLGKLLPCLRHIFKLLTVVRSSGSRHFPAFSGVVEILLNLFHAVRFPIEKIALFEPQRPGSGSVPSLSDILRCACGGNFCKTVPVAIRWKFQRVHVRKPAMPG